MKTEQQIEFDSAVKSSVELSLSGEANRNCRTVGVVVAIYVLGLVLSRGALQVDCRLTVVVD